MKVMLQDLKKGDTFIETVPVPNCGHNDVLIKVSRSVISLGTEKNIVQFGKSSYLQKAKQQPEKVKMVPVENDIETLRLEQSLWLLDFPESLDTKLKLKGSINVEDA